MLNRTQINNTTLLTLNLGKATIDQAKYFQENVTEYILDGESNLVIDCRALVWMDYAFLATLTSLMRKCISRGGDIRLVRSKYSPVWSMFELNSLSGTFKLYNDINEAIESYN